MNVVTHACAPVVVALAVDVVRLYSGRNRLFSKKHLIAVGIAGALPVERIREEVARILETA